MCQVFEPKENRLENGWNHLGGNPGTSLRHLSTNDARNYFNERTERFAEVALLFTKLTIIKTY